MTTDLKAQTPPGEPAPPARTWDSTRMAIIAVVGVVFVALLVMTGLYMRAGSHNLPSGGDPAGDPAPNFTLPMLDGPPQSMRSHFGNPIVLNFWASWCGPCVDEGPVLAAGSKRWTKQGVHFLGVDRSDGRTWAKEFEARFGITYPSFFDETDRVSRLYGTTGQPETFFIGRDGRIKQKWVGPLDQATLDQYTSLILGG